MLILLNSSAISFQRTAFSKKNLSDAKDYLRPCIIIDEPKKVPLLTAEG
jgi:restriction endonuclease